MIDFIKISTPILNFNEWLKTNKQKFNIVENTYLESGEIIFPYACSFDLYKMKVIKTYTNKHILVVTGSLHKNYFNGKNFQQFTFEMLCKEINYLCKNIDVNPKDCILQNIEVGINFETPFAPYSYLYENLIKYRCKRFNEMGNNGSSLKIGFDCNTTPKVKFYDKGKQNNLPNNLGRFELHYNKNRTIQDHLKVNTLYDLTILENCKKFIIPLITAWNSILLYEPNLKPITPFDKKLYNNSNNYKYWYKLNKHNRSTYNSHLIKYKNIVEQFGENVHLKLQNSIVEQFEFLIQNTEPKNNEMYPFINTINNESVHLINTPQQKRYCKTCGKELHPNQKNNSWYCSEKYFGIDAKKCRNQQSNPIHNYTKKVNRVFEFKRGGLLFNPNNYLLNDIKC